MVVMLLLLLLLLLLLVWVVSGCQERLLITGCVLYVATILRRASGIGRWSRLGEHRPAVRVHLRLHSH
jgi:hypothetical protein